MIMHVATGYVRDTIYIVNDMRERKVDISMKIDSKEAGKDTIRT